MTTLADALYNALKNCPCRCIMRWVKDGAEREIVAQCARCAAVSRYEAEMAPRVPPAQRVITRPA